MHAEAVRILSQRNSTGKQLDKDSDQANEEKVIDIKKLVTFIT